MTRLKTSCITAFDLWAPLTDDLKVFDKHGSAQQLCAQKVWEALLTDFPLKIKRMQTVQFYSPAKSPA